MSVDLFHNLIIPQCDITNNCLARTFSYFLVGTDETGKHIPLRIICSFEFISHFPRTEYIKNWYLNGSQWQFSLWKRMFQISCSIEKLLGAFRWNNLVSTIDIMHCQLTR